MLLELTGSSRMTKDVAGASMFGLDVNRWPAFWFDAMAVTEAARAADYLARNPEK